MSETLMVPGNRDLFAWWLQNVPGAVDQITKEMDQPDGMTQFYDRIRGYAIELFAVESQTIIFQLKEDGFIDSPDHTVFVSDEHKQVKIRITNWSEALADQITTIIEYAGKGSAAAPPTSDKIKWLDWLGKEIMRFVIHEHWDVLREVLSLLKEMIV